MKESTAFKLVKDELDRVLEDFETHNSPHESYAILKEELEELWDEIKKGNGTTDRGVSEAVQVATVALRYLIDHCDEGAATAHEKKVERWEKQRKRPLETGASHNIDRASDGSYYSG